LKQEERRSYKRTLMIDEKMRVIRKKVRYICHGMVENVWMVSMIAMNRVWNAPIAKTL
jgi:hypothetical protein